MYPKIMTATPRIEAMVKMISWVRTNRVSISDLRVASCRQWAPRGVLPAPVPGPVRAAYGPGKHRRRRLRHLGSGRRGHRLRHHRQDRPVDDRHRSGGYRSVAELGHVRRVRRRRLIGRRRRQRGVHRFVGVVQIVRITRCRNQFRVLLTPAGAQEQRALQSRNRQVDDGEQVHVVAAHRPVEQALAVRERGRVGQRRGQIRPDVGQRLDRRFQVLQVGHQIGRRIVGQLGGGVTEGAQLLQRGGDPRPSP